MRVTDFEVIDSLDRLTPRLMAELGITLEITGDSDDDSEAIPAAWRKQ